MNREELIEKLNEKLEEEECLFRDLEELELSEAVEGGLEGMAVATKTAMNTFERHGFTENQAFRLALAYFEELLKGAWDEDNA